MRSATRSWRRRRWENGISFEGPTYGTAMRIDPLPQEVLALAEHFNRRGMEVRPYAVRHNFRHSEVLAVAAVKIVGFPLPIEVILCPTEQSAIERLESVKRSPNLMHPARNGRLVMALGMWGEHDGYGEE